MGAGESPEREECRGKTSLTGAGPGPRRISAGRCRAQGVGYFSAIFLTRRHLFDEIGEGHGPSPGGRGKRATAPEASPKTKTATCRSEQERDARREDARQSPEFGRTSGRTTGVSKPVKAQRLGWRRVVVGDQRRSAASARARPKRCPAIRKATEHPAATEPPPAEGRTLHQTWKAITSRHGDAPGRECTGTSPGARCAPFPRCWHRT